MVPLVAPARCKQVTAVGLHATQGQDEDILRKPRSGALRHLVIASGRPADRASRRARRHGPLRFALRPADAHRDHPVARLAMSVRIAATAGIADATAQSPLGVLTDVRKGDPIVCRPVGSVAPLSDLCAPALDSEIIGRLKRPRRVDQRRPARPADVCCSSPTPMPRSATARRARRRRRGRFGRGSALACVGRAPTSAPESSPTCVAASKRTRPPTTCRVRQRIVDALEAELVRVAASALRRTVDDAMRILVADDDATVTADRRERGTQPRPRVLQRRRRRRRRGRPFSPDIPMSSSATG